MTIQASASNPRSNPLVGLKPADPAPAGDLPPLTSPRRRDRLELSAEATQKAVETKAASEPSLPNDAVKEPEVVKPEALKPEETSPEATSPEAKKSETSPPEAKQPEMSKPDDAEATTPTSQSKTKTGATTTSEGKQPETQTQATKAAEKKPLMNFSPYHPVIRPMQEQRTAIDALLAGQATTFKNSAGDSVPMSIAPVGVSPTGVETYTVKLGSASVEVTVAAGLDAKLLLSRVADSLSKVPEHLRGTLKKVLLETGNSPLDAYWAKVFGNEGFAAGATAGGGVITFWNLKEKPLNLSEDTFNHEMGHLIGELYTGSKVENSTRVPTGWAEAVKADDDRVSNYAGNSGDEDFAESWGYYVYALVDPRAMEALVERIPNRVKILERIYRDEIDLKGGKKDK